jgi:chromosome segregation and condensation protein ScpB
VSETDPMRETHKAQVETLLFAAEEPRTVRWMANFLKLRGRYVRKLLDELRREYRKRPGALEIREVYKDVGVPDDLEARPGEEAAAPAVEIIQTDEGLDLEEEHAEAKDLDEQDLDETPATDAAPARPKSIPAYHVAIVREHQHLVQRLMPPELSKPVLGTLSVIATRQPILQSEIIHIRGKRAYAHIKDLLVHKLIHRRPVDGTYSLGTTAEFQRRYEVDPAAVKRTRKKKRAAAKAGPPPMATPDVPASDTGIAAVRAADAATDSVPPPVPSNS